MGGLRASWRSYCFAKALMTPSILESQIHQKSCFLIANIIMQYTQAVVQSCSARTEHHVQSCDSMLCFDCSEKRKLPSKYR